MSLILFWAEVEEEEDDDENFVFSGLMKMEEEEEESLFSGLIKMESDEEEKETSVFLGVMAPDEEESDLCSEMVSDHRGWAKTRSRSHHQRTIDGQA